MNNRDLYSAVCLFIGGILTIIPILPLFNNFFPIYTYSDMIDIVGPTTGFVSFWTQTDSRIGQRNGPLGWTPLGIPTILLIFIFAIIGIFVMFLAVNTYYKFIPSYKVLSLPITSITGILAGLLILILDLLIFFGDALNSYSNGLSETLQVNTRPVAVILQATPGLGYWFLVLSGLLIICGSILNGTYSINNFFLKKVNNSNG